MYIQSIILKNSENLGMPGYFSCKIDFTIGRVK